jgi:tRNA A-37 threonylcarbamoyl transferase component Bud32
LKLLAKLHRSGAVHGGFTPRNELYVLTGDDTDGQRLNVVWIDLATCKKVPFFKREKLQKKDLDYFLSPWGGASARREELHKIYLEELKKNG